MNPLLDPAARLVIGHRGAAAYRPESTLESFRLALSQGADALEFDVRRSADGVAMIFHDPVLERTPNGHGALAERTCAELRFSSSAAQHGSRQRTARPRSKAGVASWGNEKPGREHRARIGDRRVLEPPEAS